MQVLEARHIEQSFDGRSILQDVSFRLEKGQVLGVLGSNGAGKSTLFKILAGLQTPAGGEVLIQGQLLASQYPQALARMGISIDMPVFYEGLSARDNLSIHCAYMGCQLNDSQIDSALNAMGLAASNTTALKRYSLGMRQRLALARCLIHQPDLLILDEPLNGLDPKAIVELRSVIQTQAAAGRAVLFSSHILSEVLKVADRVLVLSQGRISLDVPITELASMGDDAAQAQLIQAMEA
ncbi:hypothetical protein KIM372_04730 [Bombiscardovia nodaiensis]|uniref:ABC transporter domain-containing protein n=1 Tax=Bombiscardovia nodaiensis TaxID=2932181 RepID=A0ABN6SCM9_9BIFI|nr:hypothetical protein KIM372_04730 [Bombiscardovia nodaiensis]